jgi:V8-like Glu-specific endopeptidase
MTIDATQESTTVGKTYGYQSPQESAAATGDVAERKHQLTMQIEAFLDSLITQTRVPGEATGPSTAPPAAATTAPAAPATGTQGTAGKPGTGTAGSGAATTTTTTTTTRTGEQAASTTEAAQAREAMEVYAMREAYRTDVAKHTARQARESAAVSSSAAAASAAVIAPATSKHQSDSNRAPITESRAFSPSYGTRGPNTKTTMETVSVRLAEAPESAPVAGTVSTLRPLDAYWGSFGTPLEKATARAKAIQEAQKVQYEVILGSDDRVRVTAIDQYPWRCICALLITAQSGTQYIGTGWLVSPRVVLTAGHCVYMADEGGWVSQIEVMPGRNGTQRPNGSAISRDLRSVTGWTHDNDSDCDYGGILLPADKRYGDTLGWFGYAARDDDYLRGVSLNLSGYPGDGGKAPNQEDGTQWYMSRGVKDVMARQFSYEIDTYGGQSGSPVWEMTTGGDRYGLGIHTWGTSVANGATRITQGVFDNIVQWAGEAP